MPAGVDLLGDAREPGWKRWLKPTLTRRPLARWAARGGRSARGDARGLLDKHVRAGAERPSASGARLVVDGRHDDHVGAELEQLRKRRAGAAAVPVGRVPACLGVDVVAAERVSSAGASAAARLAPIRPQPTMATRRPPRVLPEQLRHSAGEVGRVQVCPRRAGALVGASRVLEQHSAAPGRLAGEHVGVGISEKPRRAKLKAERVRGLEQHPGAGLRQEHGPESAGTTPSGWWKQR